MLSSEQDVQDVAVTAFSAAAQEAHRRVSRLLITNPTSYVGVQLLQRFGALGYPLRCMMPTHQPMEGGFPRHTEVVVGPLQDSGSLTAALNAVDTAYYLFETAQDPAIAALFARHAHYAGVRRIIYLSWLGDDADDLPELLRRSHEIGAVLRREGKGLEVVEVRHPAIFGSGSSAFELIRSISESYPIITAMRWQRKAMQPIFIDDLLDYLVETLRLFFPPSTIVEVGGSAVASYSDVIREYCRQRQLHRLIIPIPLMMQSLSILDLQLTTSIPRQHVKTVVENGRVAMVVRDKSSTERFSIQPIGAKEAIARILSQEESLLLSKAFTIGKAKMPEGFLYNEKAAIVDVDADIAFANIIATYSTEQDKFAKGSLAYRLGAYKKPYDAIKWQQLGMGQIIGNWHVSLYEEAERILFMYNKRLPGKYWLDIVIEQLPNHASQIRLRNIFQPKGVLGRLFWYLLQPVRKWHFKHMIESMRQHASGGVAYASLKKDQSLTLFRLWLPMPTSALFRWHTTPSVMERLTPPRIVFKKIVREGTLSEGGTVTLTFNWGWLPISWQLKQSEWNENHLFSDEQIKGPFHFWRHRRHFEKGATDRSCCLVDELTYSPPLGGVGKLLFGSFLTKKLNKLFAFRHRTTIYDLSLHNKYKSPILGGKAMTIAITGSHGLIGEALTTFLLSAGFSVRRLVRADSPNNPEGVEGVGRATWLSTDGKVQKEALQGADVIIHLAGENIADGKWGSKKSKKIRQSRIDTTKALAEVLAQNPGGAKLLIGASAVGFYGDCGQEKVDESHSVGSGFLAEVCSDWEAATQPAAAAGIRVVNLRLGAVLSPKSGALKRMLTPFSLGLGGTIGTGKQCMSWIDIDDVLAIVLHIIATEGLRGPVNAVSPYPVTNYTFTKVLGRHLHRPTLFAIPAIVARLVFGKMAKEVLLSSCRAAPSKLTATGYQFLYPTLDESLDHLLT